MKYQELSRADCIESINQLKTNVTAYGLPQTAFIFISQFEERDFPLLKKYKPFTISEGFHTLILSRQRQHFFFQNRRKSIGKKYANNDASFKLHISLANIKDCDIKDINIINAFLIEQMKTLPNSAFHYKLVDPHYVSDNRFEHHDQFTLYFNKYSSLKDLLLFTTKLTKKLKSEGFLNDKGLGPKDLINLSEFVSARFDNDKLSKIYAQHPAFDLELKDFIHRYMECPEKLEEFPLCAFEIVFNNISLEHQDFAPQSKVKPSPEICQKIHNQLELLVQSPSKYLSNNEQLIIDARSYQPAVLSPLKEMKIPTSTEPEPEKKHPLPLEKPELLNTLIQIPFDTEAMITAVLTALFATLFISAVMMSAGFNLFPASAIGLALGILTGSSVFFTTFREQKTEPEQPQAAFPL